MGERADDAAARRRRLAEIFGGPLLPDSTSDEAPLDAGPAAGLGGRADDPAERWLWDNRPPHHDRH